MTLSKEKISIILARKKISVSELCETSGISRNRFYVLTNSKNIQPKTAGKFADILGVDVAEIIE